MADGLVFGLGGFLLGVGVTGLWTVWMALRTKQQQAKG